MAWYDAGAVNVTLNSATVTGVGTQWLAGARQGEAFVGPDGSLYEVLNIASDTSLTLTRPYRGATQSAQPYALAPFQGYTKELADRAAELLRRYADAAALAEGAVQRADMMTIADLVDLAGHKGLIRGAFGIGGVLDFRSGNTPDPRDLPDTFQGMGYLAGLANGGSDDATRGLGIPGLGTSTLGALEIIAPWSNTSAYGAFTRRFTFRAAEGARTYEQTAATATSWGPWNEVMTGARNLAGLADVAAARTNLGLKDLATQSQADLGLRSAAFADLIGDVDAGAVMQSGSNANGRWYRFQNGLQVCTFDTTVYSGTAVQQSWTFPAAFANSQIFIDATLALGAGTDPRLAAVSNLYGLVGQNGATLAFTSPSDVVCRLVAIGGYK